MAKPKEAPAAKLKKEIDKEVMFHKIMPSLKAMSAVTEAAPAEETAVSAEAGAPVFRSAADTPGAAPSPPADPPPHRHRRRTEHSSLSALRMTSSFTMVNLNEYLVMQKLDDALQKFRCCRCDKCRKDAAALALNKLEPHYVVAVSERVAALAEAANSAEVTNAVVQSVLKVRSKPRH